MTEQDEQLLAILEHDESYRVEKILAESPACKTERVWLGIEGPFIRKKIPLAIASPEAWRAASQVSNPRVPRIHDLYELPDLLVVVCDYVEGETLAERMKAAGRFSAIRAVSIALDVCEAAGALHACGVVHRDITPNNVVLATDGAHLVDLGIARVHGENAIRDTTALGTWGFAAPEQFGFTQTDSRSDVYSIGCLLGYMLTGITPGSTEYVRVLQDKTVVPEQLASLINMACAFEPSRRFLSAQALATALRTSGFYREEPKNAFLDYGQPMQQALQRIAIDDNSNRAQHDNGAGPFTIFPTAHPLALFKRSVEVLHKKQWNAFLVMLGGIILTLFWIVTDVTGISQTSTVAEGITVIIVLALAFASFDILCLEIPASALRRGVYAAHTSQEVRRILTKRITGWTVFLLVLFIVLIFAGATIEVILERQ